MTVIRTFDFEIDGYPDQTFRIVLDSVTYEVRFIWNERDESWLFCFGDIGSLPTFTCKLTCYTDILFPYQYRENVPKGSLYIAPLRGYTERVGRYNIGVDTGIQMAYSSPEDEVEEIE